MLDLAGLPPVLRRYLLLVIASALLAFVLALLLRGSGLDLDRLLAALALAAGAAVAGRFPLHLTAKAKVTADGAFLVAMALAFEPATAMMGAAVGVGVAQLLRRADPVEGMFNTAQTAIWVGAGSTVALMVVGVSALGRVRVVASALAALVAIYALNTLLVALAGALQDGEEPLRRWRAGLWLDLPEQAVQGAAGAVAAAAIGAQPGWAVALGLAVVAAAAYVALSRRLRPAEADPVGAALAGARRLSRWSVAPPWRIGQTWMGKTPRVE